MTNRILHETFGDGCEEYHIGNMMDKVNFTWQLQKYCISLYVTGRTNDIALNSGDDASPVFPTNQAAMGKTPETGNFLPHQDVIF